MSNRSLQKVGNNRCECPTIYHQKREWRCFSCKKVLMSSHSFQKVGNKRCECPTIYHQKRERRCFSCKKVLMSSHSLQKAGKKRLEFWTIHHQKWERRCFSARRCECPTIVCKTWVINGANARLYIIKSGSGGVLLQEGVNVQP